MARLSPAALKPPITYSFPPATAAAVSSTGVGIDASTRCTGAGGAIGEGEGGFAAIGDGLGLGVGTAGELGPQPAMNRIRHAGSDRRGRLDRTGGAMRHTILPSRSNRWSRPEPRGWGSHPTSCSRFIN